MSICRMDPPPARAGVGVEESRKRKAVAPVAGAGGAPAGALTRMCIHCAINLCANCELHTSIEPTQHLPPQAPPSKNTNRLFCHHPDPGSDPSPPFQYNKSFLYTVLIYVADPSLGQLTRPSAPVPQVRVVSAAYMPHQSSESSTYPIIACCLTLLNPEFPHLQRYVHLPPPQLLSPLPKRLPRTALPSTWHCFPHSTTK